MAVSSSNLRGFSKSTDLLDALKFIVLSQLGNLILFDLWMLQRHSLTHSLNLVTHLVTHLVARDWVSFDSLYNVEVDIKRDIVRE